MFSASLAEIPMKVEPTLKTPFPLMFLGLITDINLLLRRIEYNVNIFPCKLTSMGGWKSVATIINYVFLLKKFVQFIVSMENSNTMSGNTSKNRKRLVANST